MSRKWMDESTSQRTYDCIQMVFSAKDFCKKKSSKETNESGAACARRRQAACSLSHSCSGADVQLSVHPAHMRFISFC